jgi:hypothetical protein
MAGTACCRLVRAALDAHTAGSAQRGPNAIVALSSPESGIGDQISNVLGALTIAIGSGRRLEILPDGGGITSYVEAGFTLTFDKSYTGRRAWHDEAVRWLREEHPVRHHKSV